MNLQTDIWFLHSVTVGLIKNEMDGVLFRGKPQLLKTQNSKKKKKQYLSKINMASHPARGEQLLGYLRFHFLLKLRSSTGHHTGHNMQFSLQGDCYSELHNFLSSAEGDEW